MANVIYNKMLELVGGSTLDWASDVIRVALERDTSAYTADKDHDFYDDLGTNGFVEISVASYARQTLGTKTAAIDLTDDRYEWDAADIDFGALEAGQTVSGYVIYRQVGGDDTTPANDELLAYVDTASGLPLILNGGNVSIPTSNDVFRLAQA